MAYFTPTLYGVVSSALARCCVGVVLCDFSSAFTLTHQSWCRDAGWHNFMRRHALSSFCLCSRVKLVFFTSAVLVLICGVVVGELVESCC